MSNIKIFGVDIIVEKWISAKGTERIKLTLRSYLPKLINELKEMEGAKFEGNNLWTIKDTSRNCFTLDVLSKGEYNGQSQFYSNKIASLLNWDESSTLWQHQKNAINFKIKTRRCIDAGEMGVGKTRNTLEVLKYFRKIGWKGAIWWIAPNSALTSLRTQIYKWAQDFFIYGDKLFNYHELERKMEEAKIPPQMVVFDEFHALKNSSARRTQLAMALTELMEKQYGNDCCIFGLTGTPAPENHNDWWAPLEVIRPGWFKESSFNKYKYRIGLYGTGERADGGMYPKFEGWKGHPVTVNEKGASIPQPGNCENSKCEVCSILPKRLEGIVLVTWKKDCLDLPEKVYEEIILPPNQSTLRVAKSITKMGLRAIEVQSKLRQLSDGFQYTKENETNLEQKSTLEGESPKNEMLRQLLQEYSTPPIRLVIYAAFTASVDRCTKIALEEGWNVWQYDGRGQNYYFTKCQLRNAEIKRELQSVPKEFNETVFQEPDKYPLPLCFIGNPEAAGQGLTLTPSPAIIYFSNSFKSQFRVQSEDRIHRPGASKERGCKIIDFIHLPTDRLVLSKIKNKRDVETSTLEEINQCLENSVAGPIVLDS